MSIDYQLNPDSQKLADIEKQSKGRWVRLYLKNGEIVEAWADCWTWITGEEDVDEDVDAMLFRKRNGDLTEIAGIDIDRFEVLEERNTDRWNAHEH